jgi:hypothetical protein
MKTPLQQTPNGRQPVERRPTKWAMIVRVFLMAVAPAGFGIFIFCSGLHWEAEYNRKMEVIRRGNVQPEMLRIAKIEGGEDSTVWLERSGRKVASRSVGNLEGLRVGDKVEAYPFGDSYVIPRFDGCKYAGKWYCLIIGVGMAVVFVVLKVFSLRRCKRLAAAPPSTSSTPSLWLAPPAAFSRSSMSFDHNPADSELAALLGEAGHGLVSMSEEGGMLIARPWVLPMKWIVIWLVIFTLGLTCWMCVVLYLEPDNKMNPADVQFFGSCLFLMWLVGVPSMFSVLAYIRRALAKKAKEGDYFRVDMSRRSLELCSIGRTFRAGEIIAFTVLGRWCRKADMPGEWKATRQTGVLVRTPNNRVEHYPILHDWSEAPLTSNRSKWADRLAGIFCVPVRRIDLNKVESRELNDC